MSPAAATEEAVYKLVSQACVHSRACPPQGQSPDTVLHQVSRGISLKVVVYQYNIAWGLSTDAECSAMVIEIS